MTDRDPDDLEGQVSAAGAALRRAELEVDAHVSERLLAARRAAVAAADETAPGTSRWPLGLVSGGAMAAVAVLGLAVLLRTPQFEQLPRLEESELAAAQEVELLQDLEFVAWMIALEDENSATSG